MDWKKMKASQLLPKKSDVQKTLSIRALMCIAFFEIKKSSSGNLGKSTLH